MDKDGAERCKRIIADAVKEFVNGCLGFDDDELFDFAMTLCHRKMYIGQIENAYKISTRTIERYIEKGYLPPFKSEPSGKKYLWQDDIESFLINKQEVKDKVKKEKRMSILDKILRRKL